MKTIDKIITKVNCQYGAPMGRDDINICAVPNGKLYSQIVPLDSGGYDPGGAYWGIGRQLRVRYTKDLSYVHFYRVGDLTPIDTTATKVVFRMFKGEVIALFPHISEGKYLCSSYMHMGQHGPADYNHVVKSGKPANANQFKNLYWELVSIGYNLLVIKKAKA